ncbi:MAG: 4Fe-4S binding protein, partial [Candidatus Cloacimonadaceae bacterium]|nr:4Fe-4S binding protein [Candidatus Cloacimonadaceae bacterium]
GGRVRKFGLLFGSESISALDYIAARMMGFKVADVPYMHDALHLDGVLPSRISIPTSFRDFSLPEVDTRSVKISKDVLRFVPGLLRKAFQQAYYFYPVISKRCKRCGICVKSCPVQAIHWLPSGYPKVDKDACIKCMCCHELCPHRAVDIHKSAIAKLVMG